MPIRTHAELSLALSLALGHQTQAERDVFHKKLCFGYASTCLEAFLFNDSERFYARVNGVLQETTQENQAFYKRMAKHQLPIFPQHRLQNFLITSDFKEDISQIYRFSGFYDRQELSALLLFLAKSQRYCGQPSAWMIHSKTHCSLLCFKGQNILLCDVNHPHQALNFNGGTDQGRMALVHQLMILFDESLSDDKQKHRLITLTWYANKNQCVNIEAFKNDVEADKCFQELQSVSEEKLYQYDASGQNWLMRAILTQDRVLVNQLLSFNSQWKNRALLSHEYLFAGIMAGDLEICRSLIRHGANIHAQDARGRTALNWAILNVEPEIVKFLLENGADLQTSMDYAKRLILEGQWANERHQLTLKILQEAQPQSTNRPLLWQSAPPESASQISLEMNVLAGRANCQSTST